MTKSYKITVKGDNIAIENQGFDSIELLGLLYFLEQQQKVEMLMANKPNK